MSEAYDALVSTFEGADLAVPPVPEEFREDLRKLGEWFFSTRELERDSMYMRRPDGRGELDADVLAGGVSDFLAVSHAGHGVNSFTLNYTIATPSLVAMVHTPWGGVYMDADAQATEWARMMTGVSSLLERLREGALIGGGRLIVIKPGFEGWGEWGLTAPGPPHEEGQLVRVDGDDLFAAAIGALG